MTRYQRVSRREQVYEPADEMACMVCHEPIIGLAIIGYTVEGSDWDHWQEDLGAVHPTCEP